MRIVIGCDDEHAWRLLMLDSSGGFEESGTYKDMLRTIVDVASRVPVTLRMQDPWEGQ